MSAEAVKSEFVTREVFDAYIQSINARIKANEERADMHIERIGAIIDKNLSDISKTIRLLAEDMQRANEKMSEVKNDIKNISADVYDLKLKSGVRINDD